MVTTNDRAPIPIPDGGVRKDIHPLSLPGNALESGLNVLVNDGALRPRPAHDFVNWKSLVNWRSVFPQDYNVLGIDFDTVDTIGCCLDNGDLVFTDDSFDTTSTHKAPNNSYAKFIFYDKTNAEWIIGLANGQIYGCDTGTPTATVDWRGKYSPGGTAESTILGMALDRKNGNFCVVVYKDGLDSLIFLGATGGTFQTITNPDFHVNTDIELGYGAASADEVFVLRGADQFSGKTYDIYTIESDKVTTDSWVKRSTGKDGYGSFCGDDGTDGYLAAIYSWGNGSQVKKSLNKGAVWTTELDGSGEPSAFKRIFYTNQTGGGGGTITGWSDAGPDPPYQDNVWEATGLADPWPSSVYVDGVLCERVSSWTECVENHQYSLEEYVAGQWAIYMYCDHGDPDVAHTSVTYEQVAGGGAFLAIGAQCYVSDDCDQWTEYTPPPFDPDGINDATSDSSNWYIATATGIWRLPAYPDSAISKPQSVFQLDTNAAENQIVMATQKGWLKLDASTGVWTDITAEKTGGMDPQDGPLTGASRKSRTVFRSFTDASGTTFWLLGTNGVDVPKAWQSGLSTYRDFTGSGLPGYAKAMCISANRVVLANGPNGSPYGINCSDALNFDSGWNGLGLNFLADTQGPITAMLELNPLQFSVFKTDAIYHGISQVEFQGIAAPFRYELIKPGIIGPPAPHCLLQTHRGEQLYLGHDGGIYLYDGMSVQDIGKHARQIVEGQIDFDNIEDSWGMIDNIKRLAYFFFPITGGAMNRGIVIDLDNGAVWEIRLPPTWNAAAGKPLFVTTGITWDEVNLAWDDMNVSWDSLATTQFHNFFVLESDVWYKQRWDDLGNYTDGGQPIRVVWKPGWAMLGPMDRYVTLHEIKHLMSELHDDEVFTCRALGMDDEMVTDTAGRAAGTTEANDYEEEDTLDNEKMGYVTEFGMTAQRFTYEMSADITRRFTWNGGVARFRVRGLA